mmetsp:Transcript_43719/g.64905  ORF Transcript_43719/g.64905 Transcript_43719/m.64905 type:complete len:96 (+) Transcript_43719:83-370(+)
MKVTDKRKSAVPEDMRRKNDTPLHEDMHEDDDDGLTIRRVDGFEETEVAYDDESADGSCGPHFSELLALVGPLPHLWATAVNETFYQQPRALSYS